MNELRYRITKTEAPINVTRGVTKKEHQRLVNLLAKWEDNKPLNIEELATLAVILGIESFSNNGLVTQAISKLNKDGRRLENKGKK